MDTNSVLLTSPGFTSFLTAILEWNNIRLRSLVRQLADEG
jgi:hypothetical protein